MIGEGDWLAIKYEQVSPISLIFADELKMHGRGEEGSRCNDAERETPIKIR